MQSVVGIYNFVLDNLDNALVGTELDMVMHSHYHAKLLGKLTGGAYVSRPYNRIHTH